MPARVRQPDAPRQVATEDIATVELPGLRKDGTEIDAIWTFGSTRSPDGPIFVMVIQERGAAAFDVTEAHFRLFADSPVLAWYADPDGHIPWYNRRWFDYTGTSIEGQAGWGWESVHDPADLPRIVAKWKAGPLDVLISDIGMPEMDGYTLIERIRSRDAGAAVPAIALTAYVRSEDAERAVRAGYQEHVAKPVDASRLLDVVATWTCRSESGADTSTH